MGYELINDIEKKYPIELFTRDSVYKVEIKQIIDKIKLITISHFYKLKNKNEKQLNFIKYNYNLRLKELEILKQILIDCVSSSGNWNSFRTCLQAKLGL